MGKQILSNRIFLDNKKEQTNNTRNNMNESQQLPKQKKSNTKEAVLYDSVSRSSRKDNRNQNLLWWKADQLFPGGLRENFLE